MPAREAVTAVPSARAVGMSTPVRWRPSSGDLVVFGVVLRDVHADRQIRSVVAGKALAGSASGRHLSAQRRGQRLFLEADVGGGHAVLVPQHREAAALGAHPLADQEMDVGARIGEEVAHAGVSAAG
jgi:hypothetical protein